MSLWFEGSCEIDCDMGQVKLAFENPGEFYTGIAERMPGLTSVELVGQGDDSVTIRTSEGVMERSNISAHSDAGQVVVEFDESYAAGSKFTATSHFCEEYTRRNGGVIYRLVVSDVDAPGFLGFLYRRFGSSRIGKALLQACKDHLEEQHG